jgi:hypothetical protein
MTASRPASPLAIGNRPDAGQDRRTVTALESAPAPSRPAALRASSAPMPAADGLRLRRRRPSVADGFADGGWWPRSRDLRSELTQLLSAFWPAGQEIARVVYNPSAWGPAPRELTVAGRVVRLDRSRAQEPPLLSLVDRSGATRTDLIIIPPSTERRVAERVLALAQLGGDLHRVVGIIDRAHRRRATDKARAALG